MDDKDRLGDVRTTQSRNGRSENGGRDGKTVERNTGQETQQGETELTSDRRGKVLAIGTEQAKTRNGGPEAQPSHEKQEEESLVSGRCTSCMNYSAHKQNIR